MGILREKLSNIKTNDIFFCQTTRRIFQIVDINEQLLQGSVYNRSITIQYLDTKAKSTLSKFPFLYGNYKYLGKNPKVAQVLYSTKV